MKAKLLSAVCALALATSVPMPAHAGIISNIRDDLTKGMVAVQNWYDGSGSQAISGSIPPTGGITYSQQPSAVRDLEAKVRNTKGTTPGWTKLGVKHDGTRTYHQYRDPNGNTVTKEGSHAYRGTYGGLFPTIQTKCIGSGLQRRLM